ncbi:hypothetical protein [Spirosoma aerolatum]|uniref:hypothetical protein n=1 Tax=Spirosoma aerolatum TaxID=1211326 RepID=UPI0009AF0794|nr:hypothetical protein [Spirosoma aerolatum]
MKHCLLFFALFVTASVAWGEPLFPLLPQKSVDSLNTLLSASRQDTNRIKILLALSTDLITRHEEFDSDLGNAYAYGKQAEQLSQQLHFKVGQNQSTCVLGRIEAIQGDRKRAEQWLRNVLAYYTKQGAKSEQAATWYFLGQFMSVIAKGYLGR